MTDPRRGVDLVRGSGWWYPLIAPLAAVAYLQIGVRDVPVGDGLARLAAMSVSAAALAAFGHVLNDIADVVPDQRVGRDNAMAGLTPAVRLALAVALAVAGGVPWLLVDLPPAAVVVLVVIYLLPVLYSLPPVRLKERGLAGPLTDALNAHVVPALFAVALFAGSGPAAAPPALVAVAVTLWSTGFGLRAILAHQLDDLDKDRVAGERTFAVVVGAERARRVMARVGFPLEVVGGSALLVVVAMTWWPVVVVWGVYGVIFQAARRTGVWQVGWATTPDPDGYVLLLEWYEVWPALVLVLALTSVHPAYFVVVAVHLALFGPGIRKQLGDLATLLRGLRWKAQVAARRRSDPAG